MTDESRLASEIVERYHGRPLEARGEAGAAESHRVRLSGGGKEFYFAFTSLTNANAFAEEVGALLTVRSRTTWEAEVSSQPPAEG